MSTKIVQDRFEEYHAASRQEAENAMAEIAQEIALAGLSRSDFFKQAVFQGGTSLRILYGVARFSEDLDFILKGPDPHFRLESFLKGVQLEFAAYGIELSVEDRTKAGEAVQKAFLKGDSVGKLLSVKNLNLTGRMKALRIKLEVDTNPPAGNGFETRYLDFPFPFPITVQDPPSLFAGKSHALLTREYTKGRDWYDFVWYVGRKTQLNYRFLSSALDQTGPWQGTHPVVTKAWYLKAMRQKIELVDWHDARQDVMRFLRPADLKTIEFWSREYFLDCLEKTKAFLVDASEKPRFDT